MPKITINKKQWETIGKIAGWIDTTQNQSPEKSDFAVDIRKKSVALPQPKRNRIQKVLSELGREYHEIIPFDQIKNACNQNDVVILQEDGTIWQGMISSQGECGSEKINNSKPMIFDLAVKTDIGYMPAKQKIIMTICTMQSGKLEIVAYIS